MVCTKCIIIPLYCFSARTMDTEYDIAFHEGTVYMFEDTGLDVSP